MPPILLVHDGGEEVDACAELPVSIAGAQPLAIDVEPYPATADAGSRVLYTVTLTNQASRELNAVTLLLRVPRGLQFAAAGDADPDSSYCGNGACTATEEASWAFPALAAGATQTVTVNALVTADSPTGLLLATPWRLSANDVAAVLHIENVVAVGP